MRAIVLENNDVTRAGVAEAFSRNFVEAAARKMPGRKAARRLRSSFYDYAHAMIAAG